MPFLTNDENFRKVLQVHLTQGEELERFFGAGRKIVALTSRRLLVSNFPLLFAPKLLLEAPIDQIRGLDSVQAASMSMDLVVELEGGTARESLPTSYSDVPGELGQIFGRIQERNPAAGGASYFEEGEAEVASLPTKQGALKVTDRNLYLIGDKPAADGGVDVRRKLALGQIQELEIYQDKLDSLVVALAADGQVQLYKVGGTAMQMNDFGPTGQFVEEAWTPAKMIAQVEAGGGGRPHYLEPGESIRYSMRAGEGGTLGAINVKLVMRLTDRRLLVLRADDAGLLQPQEAWSREGVAVQKIIEQRGQHGNTLHYKLMLQTPEGELTYSIPVENREVFDAFIAELPAA